MASIAERLRERAKARDKHIDRLKVQKKIVNPIARPLTIEEMEAKLQRMEAFMTGIQAGRDQLSHAPQLMVAPGGAGLMSAAEYQFNKRAEEIIPNVWAEKRWHEQQVAAEPKEEVTNFLDEDYRCVINFVGYYIPARSKKMLPKSLAEHFRHKMSLLERNEQFQKRTGEQSFDQAADFMNFNVFAREVKSFDQTYSDVDPGTRTVFY